MRVGKLEKEMISVMNALIAQNRFSQEWLLGYLAAYMHTSNNIDVECYERVARHVSATDTLITLDVVHKIDIADAMRKLADLLITMGFDDLLNKSVEESLFVFGIARNSKTGLTMLYRNCNAMAVQVISIQDVLDALKDMTPRLLHSVDSKCDSLLCDLQNAHLADRIKSITNSCNHLGINFNMNLHDVLHIIAT